MGYAKREMPFRVLQAIGCGGDAPYIVSVCGFTCRVKQRKEIEKLVDIVGINGRFVNIFYDKVIYL